MSEPVQELEHPSDTQDVASAGRMLAAARESAGLSIEEVAAQLRLSVRQVQALEADETEALPGITFVRGFIRNYAKLLGLDAETLLAAYRVSVPDAGAHAITLKYENIPIISRDKKAWLPYVLASALVGLTLAGWMIYMEYAVEESHKAVTENVVPEKPVAPPEAVALEPAAPMLPQEPSVTPVTPDMHPAESTAAPMQPVAASIQPATVPAQPVAAPVQPVSAPAQAVARLNMTFTEQSWVSVSDRDGKEIFNKTQPAGSQGVVEGSPPFKIVIGNASGVRLTYNDKPVDLAPHAKSNVARLTLE